MNKAKTIMLQGTASDVGKSVLTTALCRIFHQDGWKVAPYKSQNMALNSTVTPDGKEIGRAQGVQAEACEIEATTDMNPILIKPTGEMNAQVVVHGKPLANLSAAQYREQFLLKAEPIVREALERLRSEYQVVVIEGAGSPAEINLKQRDIVNMRLAGWADAPVILVADIDRGGVFASIIGTMEILEEHERRRVKGFIINKFRGDLNLLTPGLEWLEQRTGLPVLGVIPYLQGLDIEAEDSVVLQSNTTAKTRAELDVAIIQLPHIANFTDVQPLMIEPDVQIRYVRQPRELQSPDAILIPGSKNTLMDLIAIRTSGWDDLLRQQMEKGCRLVGICGGYQMLGRRLLDPSQVESQAGAVDGLDLLPIETTFYPEKRTERVEGHISCDHPEWLVWQGLRIEGYEIHMGKTKILESVHRLFQIGEHWDGAVSADGQVWGTYLHGIFNNDAFRRGWLNQLRRLKGLSPIEATVSYNEHRYAAYDQLAEHVRRHLDIDQVYRIMGRNL